MSSDLETLFDSKEIASARKRAEAEFRDFTSDEITLFKRKMKSDLFFLGTVLGYSRLSPNLHGNYANWQMKHRGWRYTLELLPRNHYKSTLRTIVDSVQMSLPNEIGGEPVLDVWPYTQGPNIKLLLMHEVRDKAADFLFEVAQAFTRSEAILALFPECIPSRQTHRINRYELELPRQEIHREATFETLGSGSSQQGGHYHWLKLDDLFGDEARDSESVRARILRQFDNVQSLFTTKDDGFNLVGTRYSFNDIYYHALERYGIDVENSVLNCIPQKEIDKFGGGLLRVYARSIMENGKIIFPEEITPEKIRILRKNPVDYAAQHLNNPSEGGLTEFPWPLKFYNVNARNQRELIIFSGEAVRKIDIRDLDIVIFCDPSMGLSEHADETGIIITGVDAKSNIFILETVKKRLNPAELVDELFRLHFKYTPRAIVIEEVNFSGIYRFWMEKTAQEQKISLPLRSYKPGSQRSKEARIRGLSHFFSAGQVYVHEMMHDFRDEYEQFPLGKSQHLLDALAQGPSFWSKGEVTAERAIRNYEEKERLIIEARNITTGY